MVIMHVWFIGPEGHPGEIAGKNNIRPLFLLFWVFLFSRNSTKYFWVLVLWHLWIGRARHPGPPSQPRHLCLQFHNVALDAGVDFLAVAEHRLIPACVRSEWAWLRGKGLASTWAPACQGSSHVGNAGVGSC